jgi:hypothetical protein
VAAMASAKASCSASTNPVVLARFDPDACNPVRVTVRDPEPYLAYVRAAISTVMEKDV